MMLLVTGSRSIKDQTYVWDQLKKYPQIDQIFVGDAYGVDKSTAAFGKYFQIPVRVFHPEWNRYGRGAGIIRNHQMVDAFIQAGGRHMLAIWDGKSNGTLDTINYGAKNGLNQVVVVKN